MTGMKKAMSGEIGEGRWWPQRDQNTSCCFRGWSVSRHLRQIKGSALMVFVKEAATTTCDYAARRVTGAVSSREELEDAFEDRMNTRKMIARWNKKNAREKNRPKLKNSRSAKVVARRKHSHTLFGTLYNMSWLREELTFGGVNTRRVAEMGPL